MTTVSFDISMSLDGYVTAADQTAAEPMGSGGGVVHEWAFADDDPVNRALLANAWEKIGAVIAGRVTYDTSVPWWGANGPSGSARRPVIVVTHEVPTESPEGGVYEFVTGGLDEAVRRATAAAAGAGNVTVMGGANLGQQFIEAGLLDEISLHVAPVLFGGGTRLFDQMKIDHTRLEALEVIHTSAATHLRYRVLKPALAD